MKILAATDGSHHAEAAVKFAAFLASGFRGGRLEIVLAGDVGLDLLDGPGFRGWESAMGKEYRRWAREALERAARLAEPFGVPTSCRYLETSRLAPIPRAIARTARALSAELIVVGSSGRGTLGRAVFGSVTRRLLEESRLPIAVVPAPVAVRRGTALRLLAATDGSRGAMAAVRWAASAARRAKKGSLEIVTVGTLRHDLALGSSAAALELLREAHLDPAERREADRLLRRAAREAEKLGVRPRVEFLDPRAPHPVADVLAREATRRGAHLIAVGSSGRGAVARWALGSVTRRLMTASRRPVLVVRAG